MSRKKRLGARIFAMGLSLLLSQWAFANNTGREVVENPTALAMTTDLVVVRPALFTVTVVGSVVWLLGLPFSAAGGNIKNSAETLVLNPGKNTFVRCLGCTKAGYRQTVDVD